jgi:hypothetical protein
MASCIDLCAIADDFGLSYKSEMNSSLFPSLPSCEEPQVEILPEFSFDEHLMPFLSATDEYQNDIKPPVGNQMVPASWPPACSDQQAVMPYHSLEMTLLAQQGVPECHAALARAKEEDATDSDSKSSNSMGRRVATPEEERKVRRRRKNREAAQKSRMRKRVRLETLEQQLADQMLVYNEVVEAKAKVDWENKALRKELEYLKHVLANASPALAVAPNGQSPVHV